MYRMYWIALWPGQETRTHFLYISQTGCSGPWHVHAVSHDDPRGNKVFVVAHYNCSGVPRAILGARPRTTLSLQRCRFFSLCSRRRPCQNTTVYRRSAQLSFSWLRECAWSLRFSPLLLFTFHKAVSTCLLQVFLTIHISRPA